MNTLAARYEILSDAIYTLARADRGPLLAALDSAHSLCLAAECDAAVARSIDTGCAAMFRKWTGQ